MLIIDKLSY